MAQWNIADRSAVGRGAPAGSATFAIVALAGMSLLALVRLIPAPLLLPSVSVVLLGFAGVFALLAWRLHIQRRSDRVDLWDVAGACAFIGFAAGMLSQPEQVLDAFGSTGMTAQREAP